jgi:CelD/BcsL family acetyltransferase involved in cellulose biosynthesis
MSELELRTLASIDEVSALEDEWDALVTAAPRPSPFLLNAWIVEWWRHYGDGASLHVHTARRDGKLVGALPLYTRRERGLRITAFVGAGASALADVLVAAGEEDQAVPRALVEGARAARHDLVDVFGLPDSSRLAAAVGPNLRLIERVEAPVLDLSPGWEAVYAAKTSSKKRNLHKRRRRQLSEQGELTVEVARTLAELEPALEAAFELHEKRWRGRPDGSGFATPVGRRFNRAVVRRLAPSGRPRIVTLKLDGSAIAFHYYFALADCMYVYRLAFDPALSRFSPGLVNTLDALAAASDEGLRKVEYLGGDERYKLELSDGLEPLYQGIGLAATPQGRAVVHARLAMIQTRRRLKRSPTLKRIYFEGLAPARRALARLRPREATSE